MKFAIDRVEFQPALPADRWYDTIKRIIYPDFATNKRKEQAIQYHQLDFRDLVYIEFGYPIKETVSESKEIAYTTETINWVEIGRKTETYINSKLHDDLKKVNSEIEIYNKDIA